MGSEICQEVGVGLINFSLGATPQSAIQAVVEVLLIRSQSLCIAANSPREKWQGKDKGRGMRMK